MMMLESVMIAFSMFSAIPMPQREWNERNIRYSLCAFPLVGAVIGVCGWGWWRLCLRFALPQLLRGAGLCLLPVMITGGIHLDGYADTWDALACHGSREKRQEILKDPHLGAFAGIRLCMYFTATLALWTVAEELPLTVLMGIFALSRTLSGLALVTFPLREGSGLARLFAEAAERKSVRMALLALGALLLTLLCLKGAWPAAPAAAGVFLVWRRMCVRDFGGLSGDLAGWFVQTAELWMLAAVILRQLIN